MPNGFEKDALVKTVGPKLPDLTVGQLKWIDRLIEQFRTFHEFKRWKDSDIIPIPKDYGIGYIL